MRAYIYRIIIFVLFSNIVFTQTSEDAIIAYVGDDKITAGEFLELYELNPHISKDNDGSFYGKLNFLNTIIAYKLWDQNKEYLKVDTSLPFMTAVGEIRKMFVRDALYRKEILGKIDVTPQEFSEAKLKKQKNLEVSYILSQDEKEIKNLMTLLNAGHPFDSLLAVRDEADYQKEPVIVKFGDYNEAAENQLYKLQPGEYSSIIHFKDADYIFFLKRTIPVFQEEEKSREKILDIIKKRKEAVVLDKFMKNILNGVKADLKSSLYAKLEKKIIDVFSGNEKLNRKDSLNSLTQEEFLIIENSFTEEELNSVFITLPENTISLRNALRALFFTGIKMPADTTMMKGIFSTYIKDLITKEIIFLEGEKQGLEHSPEVQKYVKMWSGYYAFETSRGAMLDTIHVSSEEIEQAYKEQYKNDLSGNMAPEKAKPVLCKMIADKKINKAVTDITAGFASGKTINIDYDALKKIETTQINSLVMRNLGFGGTISAVPLYIPNYRWTYSVKSINPIP